MKPSSEKVLSAKAEPVAKEPAVKEPAKASSEKVLSAKAEPVAKEPAVKEPAKPNSEKVLSAKAEPVQRSQRSRNRRKRTRKRFNRPRVEPVKLPTVTEGPAEPPPAKIQTAKIEPAKMPPSEEPTVNVQLSNRSMETASTKLADGFDFPGGQAGRRGLLQGARLPGGWTPGRRLGWSARGRHGFQRSNLLHRGRNRGVCARRASGLGQRRDCAARLSGGRHGEAYRLALRPPAHDPWCATGKSSRVGS